MRGALRKLVWLLLLNSTLCCLPRLCAAASTEFKSAYSFHSTAQETFSSYLTHERRHLLYASSSVLATFSPTASPAPTPASAPAPTPGPLPSDPPLTIPFIAPSPGPLTIPIPDGPLTPKLSGNCSLNFTAVAASFQRTAYDCAYPLAAYVGVVICCPQFESLLRIMQGQHMSSTGALALNSTEAVYCFSDTMNLLSSLLANSSIPALCKVKPSNLTVASCPVTTVSEFQQLVNTTSLLEACDAVDNLKECTSQTCQSQISNATLKLAKGFSNTQPQQHTLDDCESLVLSWLGSQLTPVAANSALRTIMSCSVNQVCPLVFSDTSEVASSCHSTISSNTTCCKSLDDYLIVVQKQMLITNQQAYKCAANLSKKLQIQGVTTDIYSLCNIDLRDFSLQGQGSEGCLLPSQPTDVNATSAEITFICDLNDNIGAQWPQAPILAPIQSNVSSPTPSVIAPSTSSSYTGSGLGILSFLMAVLLSVMIL